MLARAVRKILSVLGIYELFLSDAAKRARADLKHLDDRQDKHLQRSNKAAEGLKELQDLQRRSLDEEKSAREAALAAIGDRLDTVVNDVKALGRRQRTAESRVEQHVLSQLDALAPADDRGDADDVDGLLRRRFISKQARKLEAEAEVLLRDTPGWPVIERYLEASGSTGCSFIDYWTLHDLVRTRQPKEVLECGTGTSTVVMALALLENEREGHPGRLTSMESVSRWYEHAVGLLPAEVADVVDLRHSERQEYTFSMFRGYGYADVPARDYTIVFVDGPSTRDPEGAVTFDFDYVNVVRRSNSPVLGVIDTRLSTCYAFAKIFGDDKVRYDEIRSLGFVGPCTRSDLKWLRGSSGPALKGSIRLYGRTRFSLDMDREQIDGKAPTSPSDGTT